MRRRKTHLDPHEYMEAAREAGVREVDDGPFRGRVSYLIVSGADDAPAPQAFLVEQAPDWSFVPHLHLQDEFQIVVAGSGSLQGTPLAPVTVHYAARQTIYGPLKAGAEGVSYFTIRGVTDSGIWPLSEARQMATPGLRRFQTHSEVMPFSGGARVVEPLSGLPEGTGCWFHTLAPGEAISIATDDGGSGTFLPGLTGEIGAEDGALVPMAARYSSADEPSAQFVAGTEGASFLRMQFAANRIEG